MFKLYYTSQAKIAVGLTKVLLENQKTKVFFRCLSTAGFLLPSFVTFVFIKNRTT